METITMPYRCSKCRETIGTVSCEGCKDIFCTKHITKHRQELFTKLNHHMFLHNDILNQLLGKEKKSESSKKDILSQINQWEKYMIERIQYKAELARERLDQLTGKDEKVIIENAQELTKKINKRDKTKDPLEEDIELLKQSIIHVKQAFDKLTRQSDVELYIEPSHMIDWNHLIYVREKSVKVVSAFINKQTTNKDSKDAKISTESNQQRKSTSYYNPKSSSSSISSDDESSLQEMNSSYDPYPLVRRLSNERISSSTQTKPSPPQLEKQVSSSPVPVTLSCGLRLSSVKRERRPLMILDPISDKAVEVVIPSPTTDISRTRSEVKSKSETTSSPSSATDKTKQQNEWSHWLAEILSDSSTT